jgi:hypothetical protein
MTQHEKNISLAVSIFGQCEDVLDDFIRENLDQNLELDDLVQQYDTVRNFVREHLFKE